MATGFGFAETADEPLVEWWILPLVVSLVLIVIGPLLLTASPTASARWQPASAEEP